ncbi:hypothetical protein H0H92_014810, partial [Tricholoma furcatifolium]
ALSVCDPGGSCRQSKVGMRSEDGRLVVHAKAGLQTGSAGGKRRGWHLDAAYSEYAVECSLADSQELRDDWCHLDLTKAEKKDGARVKTEVKGKTEAATVKLEGGGD